MRTGGVYYVMRPLVMGVGRVSALAAVVAAPLLTPPAPAVVKPPREKRVIAPKVAYIKGK